jgi:hypothetical protein
MKTPQKLGAICAAFAIASSAAQAVDVLYIQNSGSSSPNYQAFVENKFGVGTWTKAINGTGAGQVGGDLDRVTDFPVSGTHGGTGITVRAYLESFDLIIAGNQVTSTAYQDDADGADWAAITKPILFHAHLAARELGGRPGMFTGDNTISFALDLTDAADTTRVLATPRADAIFDGVTEETDLYDDAILTTVDTISKVGDPGTGAEVISDLTNATAVTSAHGIVFWDAGSTNGAELTLAGKRAFFAMKNTGAPEALDTLTEDGQVVLGNLIDELLVSAPVVFLPPSGLTAKSGITEIDLSWTATTGAVSYNVKRSEVQGGPYTTISTPGTVTGTTYTDTGLTNGTTYYYVVSAVNGAATVSGDSAEASTYPVDAIQPATNILYLANATNAAYQNFATNGQFADNTWTVKGLGTGTDQVGGDLDRVTDFTGPNGGTGITVKQYLESFDFIIAGLPTNSTAFVDGVNGADWAQIAKPILFNSSFAARSLNGRTAMFFSAANGDGALTFTFTEPNESVRVSATALGDAIFDGVTDDTNLYTAGSTDTLLGTDAIGGGEIISNVTDGTDTHYGVVFWNAGTTTGGGQLLFKNRAFLPLKSDGTNDLSTDGKIVMGNLINQLLVPTATIFPPPSNIVAKSGIEEIDLSWTAAVGAVSYNVKRSETQGGRLHRDQHPRRRDRHHLHRHRPHQRHHLLLCDFRGELRSARKRRLARSQRRSGALHSTGNQYPLCIELQQRGL